MAIRVLYLAGSPVARVAARLPDAFAPVPVGLAERPGPGEPRVLLIDAARDDLIRVAELASEATNLAVVALAEPSVVAGCVPNGWYALLEATVPSPVLARTLQNAFEHMAARGDLACLSKEL